MRLNILLIIISFIKLAAENFTARLAKANLANKSDVANFAKKWQTLIIN